MDNNKICPECFMENAENATYCGTCGARLDGKFNCPTCGTLIENKENFCPTCGRRFDGKKECPKCKTLLNNEIQFCTNCGFSFKNEKESLINNEKTKADTDNNTKTIKDKKDKKTTDEKNKLWKKIKFSSICLLSLIMLILSFTPIFVSTDVYSDSEIEQISNKPLKLTSIDYIGFMFDLAYNYNSEYELENSRLYAKTEILTDEISDLMVEDTTLSKYLAAQKIPLLCKYLTKLSLRSQSFDSYQNSSYNSQSIYFVTMGLLSLLYILSSLLVFLFSLKYLIKTLKNKECKLNKLFQFIITVPLIFVFMIMYLGTGVPSTIVGLGANLFTLNISSCLIAFLCMNLILIILYAIFYFMKNGIKNKNRFTIKLIAFLLIFTSLSVANLSVFKIQATVQASNRYAVTTYTGNYYTKDLYEGFLSKEEVQTLDSIYNSDYINNYIDTLENTNARDINDSILNNLSPEKLFAINGHGSLKALLNISYIFNLLIFIFLGITIGLAYTSLLENNRKRDTLQKVLLILSGSLTLAVLVLVIIAVLSVNLLLPINLSCIIGEGSIILFIFILLSIIFSFIKPKNIDTEESVIAKI
ncbi:MAG: zinc ribbon domain-containing protein [Clostridia bacterium]